MIDKQIEDMALDMSDALVYFSGEPKIINWVKTLENMYSKGYRKATDVAREVFEEIESICTDFPVHGNIHTVILSEIDLAELKKKYESEGEGCKQ